MRSHSVIGRLRALAKKKRLVIGERHFAHWLRRRSRRRCHLRRHQRTEGKRQDLRKWRVKGSKVKRWKMCVTLSVCAGACGCVLTHGSPGAVCVRAAAPQIQADVGSSQWGPAPGEASSASGRHTQSSLQVGETGRNDADKWRERDRWEISRERGEKIGEREATGFQNICDVRMHNSIATGDQTQIKPAEASNSNSKQPCP